LYKSRRNDDAAEVHPRAKFDPPASRAKFASLKFASLKFASLKFASLKFASLKFASLKFASLKFGSPGQLQC
jgi:hypothetical protein